MADYALALAAVNELVGKVTAVIERVARPEEIAVDVGSDLYPMCRDRPDITAAMLAVTTIELARLRQFVAVLPVGNEVPGG